MLASSSTSDHSARTPQCRGWLAVRADGTLRALRGSRDEPYGGYPAAEAPHRLGKPFDPRIPHPAPQPLRP
jgi:hypothetical protein